MARNEYEAGLKMMEELTTNAQQIQELVLGEILRRNAETEYLRGFLHGQTDKQLFKNNVPIITYEDIKPYIDRIVNGETSNILLAEHVIGFFRSSGTSGGQPKLITATAEFANKMAIFQSLLGSVMIKHQAEHVQSIVGLIQRDKVGTFSSAFASTVLRVIKFLEDYWKELCSNIKAGQISAWITDVGCRNAVSLIMKPNPELAKVIEHICSCKSWEGIIKKLWPKAKSIRGITTGVMSQNTATLDFYGGGLPLVSAFYVSSEAFFGINFEPLTKPSDMSYIFVLNMAYFEFLPLKKDSVTMSQEVQFNGVSHHDSIEMKSNNEDTEPVDLVNVKPGQCYELVVTTYTGLYRYKVGEIILVTGFHNKTPQLQIVGRQNVCLSIDADKTSEADLLKAVTEAKTHLDPLGFILTGYTSYGDTSSIPGHYVLFWELMVKEGNNMKELDPKIMVECCSRMEESLDYVYRFQRKKNAIAPLEIRVIKQGTLVALMDYYVSQGASMSRYKAPSCIRSKEAIKILYSRVIGKFFSPKTPM
ncbi:hypothetical protein CRYUN_Cryun11dG0036500 [Craigia yunnanensis]